MRLPDAENRTCLGLSETALLDQTVDLKREPRLKSLPLRVGKAEIGENVAAALFDSDRIVLRFSCTSVVSTNLPQDAPYRLRPERLLRQPGCRGGPTLEARHAQRIQACVIGVHLRLSAAYRVIGTDPQEVYGRR